MKIVFYSQSTTLYGAPTSLLNLIQEITVSRSDSKLYVIIPAAGVLATELEKLPITVIRLPFYKWVYSYSLFNRKKKQGRMIAYLWFIKNCLTKLGLNLFWLPAHILAVRKISPDLIYTNSSLSPVGVMVARILGIRSVWHHRETINDEETSFFLEWGEWISRRVLNWPDIHFHPSQFLKASYESFISSGRSYVVYNGVEWPAQGVESPPDNGLLVFGMVGRISPQKGQHEIIRAFGEMGGAGLQLNLYGAGEKYYVDQVKQAAGDSVLFKGFKSKAQIYPEISFLVMNARNESFGRVVAEANAYGVPVIALRSGAVPELIDDRVTGYLFNDMAEFKAVVNDLVTVKKDAYERMRENCRRKFKENFTVEKYARDIYDILETANRQAGQ